MQIGLQLYTVRDKLSEDFKGTIEAVAKLGYKGVEFCGFGDMSPAELKAFVDDLGISAAGCHTNLDAMINGTGGLYDYCEALDCNYVTTSLCGEVAKDWKATIQQCIEAGRAAREKGVTFTYHNHAQEFEKIDGVYALDLLYETAAASEVQCEIDTMWVRVGGEDPGAYLRKYAGRVPQVHLKDVTFVDGQHQFTEVGTGEIDLDDVFAAAKEIKAEWVIVEQDQSQGDSLDSARISFENLQKGGYI